MNTRADTRHTHTHPLLACLAVAGRPGLELAPGVQASSWPHFLRGSALHRRAPSFGGPASTAAPLASARRPQPMPSWPAACLPRPLGPSAVLPVPDGGCTLAPALQSCSSPPTDYAHIFCMHTGSGIMHRKSSSVQKLTVTAVDLITKILDKVKSINHKGWMNITIL